MRCLSVLKSVRKNIDREFTADEMRPNDAECWWLEDIPAIKMSSLMINGLRNDLSCSGSLVWILWIRSVSETEVLQIDRSKVHPQPKIGCTFIAAAIKLD